MYVYIYMYIYMYMYVCIHVHIHEELSGYLGLIYFDIITHRSIMFLADVTRYSIFVYFRWSVQRERIEKLTMQAISNVAQKMDEFVTNQLISHDKVRPMKSK